VNMVHGGNYTLYNKSLKILYKSIEYHAIAIALSMNRSVVIDRGVDIGTSGRKRWIVLAKSFDVPCEAIVFPFEGALLHAQRRFENDNRGHQLGYWEDVALAHAKRYVEPGELTAKPEGFDAIHHITFEEIKQGKVFT
jgi:hypothetical protein